jgi:aquaporin Z
MARDEVENQEENTVEPTFVLKLLCEFVGTFGLAYTVAMTAASTDDGSGGSMGLAPVAVPVCAAAYLILMVYGIGSVSGCHINPGVSTAVFGWQCISGTNPNFAIEFIAYVLTQVAGGVLGGVVGVFFWIESTKFDVINPYGIYPYVPQRNTMVMAMITEMLAIFFFTFAILRTCCDHDKPPMVTDGLVIGIALFTAIVGTASMSGGGVNPAVATALRVANYVLEGEYDHSAWWEEGSFVVVYWIGPILGGILAAMTHYLIEAQTSKVFVGYKISHD